MKFSVKSIVNVSLLAALIYIGTIVLTLPIPMGGYVHMGDAIIFIAASFLAPPLSFLATAIGSGLADFTLGYSEYILPTIIIKGLMAFTAAFIIKKLNKKAKLLYAILTGTVILLLGYGITDYFIFGSVEAAMAVMPWNLAQVLTGGLVAFLVLRSLKALLMQSKK